MLIIAKEGRQGRCSKAHGSSLENKEAARNIGQPSYFFAFNMHIFAMLAVSPS